MRGNRRNLIIIVYLLMVILLARVIIWIEPAQLKKKMSEGLSENAEKLVIYIMQESNIKVSYIMRDDSNVMEKLADSVNRTSNVYSFVENSYSKENLVIYDPNTYKTTQIAVAEQTVTQE